MLQDPEFAAIYLEESIAEDMESFKAALKHVAEAYPGGLSALSRKTHLNRESLYRTLSRGGNPNLKTLNKILGAFGLRISVTPRITTARDSAGAQANGLESDDIHTDGPVKMLG
jgi:probable addiction module antidote protein